MSDLWDPRNLPDGTIGGRGLDTISRAVAAGYDYDTVLNTTVFDIMEYLEDRVRTGDTADLPSDDLAALRRWVVGVLDAEFAAARQPEPGAAGLRDSDRLTRAFRELDLAGIIARERFDRNGREANGRLAGRVADTPGARGFACYTAEDAELAASGGTVLVGFGAREGTHEANAMIGAEVVRVLRSHGLRVQWNDDPRRRIEVSADAAWPRRGRAAVVPPAGGDDARHLAWRVDTTTSRAGVYGPPRWMRRAPDPSGAEELSRMVLPWLPTGIAVVLRDARGRELTVTRDFDALLVRGEGTAARLPRHGARPALAAWDAGGPPPDGGTAEPEPELLEVAYSDVGEEGIGGLDLAEPMDLTQCTELLYRLTPEEGSFLVAAGRSGATIQVMWHHGPKLWVEHPDPAAREARGRHAALDRAEELLTVLATEDRADIGRLGDLQTVAW